MALCAYARVLAGYGGISGPPECVFRPFPGAVVPSGLTAGEVAEAAGVFSILHRPPSLSGS